MAGSPHTSTGDLAQGWSEVEDAMHHSHPRPPQGPSPRGLRRSITTTVLLALSPPGPSSAVAASPGDDWPGFGGPTRNFQIASDQAAWRETPRVRWRRPLGSGTAGIAASADLLFTQYAEGRTEHVVAVDAASGETRWDRSYEVDVAPNRRAHAGPKACPLALGDRVVSVGIDARVQARARADGSLLWEKDLVRDLDTVLPQSGYAASPLRAGEVVLLPGLGGPGPAAIALDPRTGRTVWARHAFLSSHASPILIRFGGREHAVFHGMNWLVGLDPETGELLWRHRLRDAAIDNVCVTPLWDPERALLVVSHTYDGVGARGLRLVESEGDFAVEPVWTSRRLKIEHGNAVLVRGVLYASDGSEPAFFVGLDVATGTLKFKQRGLSKSTLLARGGELLILDEDGTVHRARPGEDAVRLLSSTQVLGTPAWTVPTPAYGRLYLRDHDELVCLEMWR